MTADYPPMPAVSATVHLHGGAITRVNDLRFVVTHSDGSTYSLNNHGTVAEIRYRSAINLLRKRADLKPLPLPCLHCLVKPRRDCNSFCSGQCEALHYGRPAPVPRSRRTSSPRHYEPKTEQALPPHDVIMETLAQYHRDPVPEAPLDALRAPPSVGTDAKPVSLRDARLKADALILRLGGELPRDREQFISREWTEREETA